MDLFARLIKILTLSGGGVEVLQCVLSRLQSLGMRLDNGSLGRCSRTWGWLVEQIRNNVGCLLVDGDVGPVTRETWRLLKFTIYATQVLLVRAPDLTVQHSFSNISAASIVMAASVLLILT
ncbi:hypothetical protein Pmani_018415 [Petrolisthes manimaculis]|uniref:Uncharacterized protein n=1 Tax=Petrolisthes manimaculis TaxID=1843537 RepID=A0AAE1U4V8_9EUCA|nr:hypothetical protein Pmani_018415 [Petrolisthes manimaculis]